jgi:hypothetical protein
VCADASTTDAYSGAVPVNVVLACGVFGNITDADAEHTVHSFPSLCAPGAHVIWTRHRRAPDLTVDIRRWFAASGFEELAFISPPDTFYGVGMHRLVGEPAPYQVGVRLFTFVGFDGL